MVSIIIFAKHFNKRKSYFIKPISDDFSLGKNGYLEHYIKINMTGIFCSIKKNVDALMVLSN